MQPSQSTVFLRRRSLTIALAPLTLGLMATPLSHAQSEVTELAPILVEGDPEVITEGTDSYTTTRATVGSKQPVDVREVPQTINVLTDQRLEDADAHTIEEAAYILPNLFTATGNGFAGSLYSRGHEVFTYNIDGAPRPYLSLYGTAPDLVFFDRMEVLSGPTGVYQGTGEPVGTVNLVRKRPTADFQARGAISYGSYEKFRIEGDVSGPLNEAASVRGRLIGYGSTENSFMDYAGRDKAGGYGSLDFDAGDATTISIGGIIENNDVTAMSGLPTYTDGRLLNVSRSTFIGADWNSNDSKTREGFAEVEHEFDNGGVIKVIGRVFERDTDIKTALATTGVDPTTGDFEMMTFARNYDETTDYVDANYTAPFFLRGNRSEYTVGVDMRRVDSGFEQNFDFGIPTQNINNFNPKAIEEPEIEFPGVGPGFRLNTSTDSEEVSIYGWGRFRVTEGLLLSLGGRYISYDSKSKDLGRDMVTADIDESRFVPFLGIGYDLNQNLTAYTSYSEIFQPQNGDLATGARIEPLEGRQIEVGLKGSWMNGMLNAQGALFRIEDENRAIPDPDNVGAVIGAPKTTNKGIELNVGGSPIEGLDITGGYAYVNTDFEEDPIPEHVFNLWGKYSFNEGTLKGAYAGLGVRYSSSIDTISGGVEIEAPSYTVFDALLGYKVNDDVDVELYVKNLFDKKYVERIIDVTRGTFYGTPLSANLRLNARF